MCAYAHLPLPYAHSLTNGYLLNCQSQCPVTWRDIINMSAAVTARTARDFAANDLQLHMTTVYMD